MYLCSYVFKNQRTKAFCRLFFRHMSIRTTISIITFAPRKVTIDGYVFQNVPKHGVYIQNGKKHVK